MRHGFAKNLAERDDHRPLYVPGIDRTRPVSDPFQHSMRSRHPVIALPKSCWLVFWLCLQSGRAACSGSRPSRTAWGTGHATRPECLLRSISAVMALCGFPRGSPVVLLLCFAVSISLERAIEVRHTPAWPVAELWHRDQHGPRESGSADKPPSQRNDLLRRPWIDQVPAMTKRCRETLGHNQDD